MNRIFTDAEGRSGRAETDQPNCLHLDTVLQRRDEIDITLTPTGLVELETPSGRMKLPGHVLSILDVFSNPTIVRDGLRALGLRATGASDFKSMTETLITMIDRGALIDRHTRRVSITRETRTYAGSKVHVGMLNDRVRTGAFLEAINRTVRPGDVVIDLGTGTGILAIRAAKAGAARVYAIEASSIADVAEKSLRTNLVSDRVTVVRGWSKTVQLPERADVLVSELIGNDPFDEDFIDVISDARDRLLKTGGRIVPVRLTAFAQAFEIPGPQIDRFTFTAANTSRWEDWYGVKFDDFAEVATVNPHFALTTPATVETWRALAEPLCLVAYSTIEKAQSDFITDCAFAFTEAGTCNGLLVYFEADLGHGNVISTRPGIAAASNHWACRVWLYPQGLPTAIGSVGQLSFAVRRGISVQSFSVQR